MKNDIIARSSQIFKFGIVGGINTLISLIGYYILIVLNFDYTLSTVISYLISALVGYYLNRVWVFKANNIKVSSSILKYIIVYGSSLLINVGCMHVWIDKLHLSEFIAPLLTLSVTVPFNFILSKIWTFRK